MCLSIKHSIEGVASVLYEVLLLFHWKIEANFDTLSYSWRHVHNNWECYNLLCLTLKICLSSFSGLDVWVFRLSSFVLRSNFVFIVIYVKKERQKRGRWYGIQNGGEWRVTTRPEKRGRGKGRTTLNSSNSVSLLILEKFPFEGNNNWET